MSQSAQSVPNGTGAAVRAGINTALAALFSNNSGSSAPSVTVAHMWWPDTTTSILWKRNAANTGWLNFGTLDETYALSRSSNTMLDISDAGKAIIGTSTFAQTFDTCANLKDGWSISYKNNGSGSITLTPGSGTIDGVSSLALAPQQACTIYCNGSNLFTFGLGAGLATANTWTARQVFSAGFNSTDINGGQFGGFRNRLLNGSFIINQRRPVGTSVTGTGAYQYTTDRWTFFGGTENTLVVNNSSGLTSLNNYCRLGRTAGQTGTTTRFLAQPLTTVNSLPMQNQSVTLSFWARKGANFSPANGGITAFIATGTGSDQSGASLGAGTWTGYALPGSQLCVPASANTWEKFSVTAALGSGISQVGVAFQCAASVGTAGADDWIDITGVQLEIGSVATPFESRTFETELAMCQAYYEKSFPYATAPAQNAGGGSANFTGMVTNARHSVHVSFKTRKRTTPTITTFSPNGASANWLTNASVTPIAAVLNVIEESMRLVATTPVALGADFSINWTADAEM